MTLVRQYPKYWFRNSSITLCQICMILCMFSCYMTGRYASDFESDQLRRSYGPFHFRISICKLSHDARDDYRNDPRPFVCACFRGCVHPSVPNRVSSYSIGRISQYNNPNNRSTRGNSGSYPFKLSCPVLLCSIRYVRLVFGLLITIGRIFSFSNGKKNLKFK